VRRIARCFSTAAGASTSWHRQTAPGPSGGWFIRDLVVGKVAQHRGSIQRAEVRGQQVGLTIQSADGKTTDLLVDHVVAGTGYRYEVAKAPFLDDKIKAAVKVEEGYPALTRNFESSVPGLYFVGLPAANTFGPVQRFAWARDLPRRESPRIWSEAARPWKSAGRSGLPTRPFSEQELSAVTVAPWHCALGFNAAGAV